MPGGATTVCFVGRHNRVKGYDLLYQGAEPVMDAGRINVVVAGSPGPLPTPVHDRWTEFGWTDRAPRLIAQSDAFVLPNRSTYFDIVALEVLALGRPLLASATGGNKVLGRRSGGVVLFEPSVEGLRDALEKAAGWDRSEIDRLGRENRTCYQDHFTEIAFANRYVAAMAAIPAARGAGL